MNTSTLAIAVSVSLLFIASVRSVEAQGIIEMDSLIENLSERKTRAQRDAFWSQADGKLAGIVGRVSDVKGSGFLPARIEMDLLPTWENSGVCAVNPKHELEMLEINVGDIVGCVGNLSNYTTIFGHLTIGISAAEFKKLN